ncbi:minor capsid protein [Alteribacillus sp. YIM 98480]|uniref:minor capsid protein n=1 Tax=Alteribacillus sp. YIM 98480 TaxID=2606599 RepID=UPI00131A7B2E|nr:minor capsid protein [Alteribacillus sp. YIM 98480]
MLEDELLNVLAQLLDESDQDYKKVLEQYDVSKEKLEKLIFKLYKKHSNEDGEIDYSSAVTSGTMREINETIEEESETIGALEVATMTAVLASTYRKSYHQTAFTMDQNTDLAINFKKLNDSIVNQFIKQDWSGAIFSDRIWRNQAALKDSLKRNLERGIREGQNIKKMAKLFDEEFGTKRFQSQRLVRTETAYIITEARENVYKQNGIEQVQWLATLEGNTCSDCAELDRQVWNIDDSARPIVPFHPNCRCDIIPVIPNNLGSDMRKDNETKEYVKNQSYKEWAKDKGIEV